jgi:hypothetical protein
VPNQPVFECSFLIPVRRDTNLSDGKLHEPEAWQQLVDELYQRFGGGTRSRERYEGFYRDPDTGEQVSDESVKYIVAVPRARVRDVRSFLSEMCELFQQKCIYLSVAGRVEFIEAPK